MSEPHLFTSESVTEGHPDKVADQISDGVLDAVLRDDPTGRVACETLVNTGLVVGLGRDLAGDDHQACVDQRLAGDPAARVGGEHRVEDAVGDLVGDLVGMALGHRLGGEQVLVVAQGLGLSHGARG